MSIKKYLLLCCFFSLCAANAIAVSPHDEKTCIDGTNFDIKRVRKLIVEGKEVPDYGEWERKTLTLSGPEIASSYRNWFYWIFLDKYRRAAGTKTRSVYSLHIRDAQDVKSQLRTVIAEKTGVRPDNLSEEISIPYRGEGGLTDAWSSEVTLWKRYVFFYQFRPDEPKFEVTNEYFEILNPRAQKVIESVCRPKSNICLDRSDKVFLGKFHLKRPCWKEEITYNCKTEPQNGCQHFIDQGYKQYRSTCLLKQEDLCLKWKRYYVRPGEGQSAEDDYDGYDGNDTNGRQRVFEFPKRENSKNASGLQANKDDNEQDLKNQNTNNGFQKYQSIPIKGSGSTGGGSGNAHDGKGSEHDAVIAQSIPIDPDFLLQEGTYIPCSLTMQFVSDVAGRIQCMINQDVYGSSGRVKLIERGTKAIGVYQSGTLAPGMARMHVIWTKLLTPDHKQVKLVDTHVVGRLGEAGIDGRVNSHFAQRFGGALMVSLIKDVVAGVSAKHSENKRKDAININTFENTKDSTTSIVERMLDASINIPPTMYKKQGDIIGIEVGKDIDFSRIYKIQSMR